MESKGLFGHRRCGSYIFNRKGILSFNDDLMYLHLCLAFKTNIIFISIVLNFI